MKIKRKLFTRAQQLAYQELKMATNSFRKLPKTTNPRDVIRLKQLSRDLQRVSAGDTKNIDVAGAKKLLHNAGFPNAANEVEGVIKKYTNKRALVRLKNIKNQSSNKQAELTKAEETVKRLDHKEAGFNKTWARGERELTKAKIEDKKGDSAELKKIRGQVFNDVKKRDIMRDEKGKPILNKEGKKISLIKVGVGKENNFTSDPDSMVNNYDSVNKPGYIERFYKKNTKGGSIEISRADMKPDPGTNTVLHETGHTREKFQSSGKAGIPTIENLRSLKENDPITYNELKRENPDLFKAADLHKSVGKKTKSDYGKEKIVMGADFFRRAADGFSTVVDEATANSYGKAQANKLGIKRTFDKFSEGNQSSYAGDSAASNILKTKNDLKQHIKNHN